MPPTSATGTLSQSYSNTHTHTHTHTHSLLTVRETSTTPALYLRYLKCTTLPSQNHPSNDQATNVRLEALGLALSNQPGSRRRTRKPPCEQASMAANVEGRQGNMSNAVRRTIDDENFFEGQREKRQGGDGEEG